MPRLYVYEVTRVERSSSMYGKDYSMKVEDHSLGLFSSKKNAEKAIARCVKDFASAKGWTYGLVGFYVEKFLIDRTLSEKDTWTSIVESRWSYTKDGKPLSYSLFSSDWQKGKYLGTPSDAIKFKVGDYAWQYACSRFVPVKVLAQPYTPEKWHKRFGFASDASDDCYLVVSALGHDHPQTVSLFPLDSPLPKKAIDSLSVAEKEYCGK